MDKYGWSWAVLFTNGMFEEKGRISFSVWELAKEVYEKYSKKYKYVRLVQYYSVAETLTQNYEGE